MATTAHEEQDLHLQVATLREQVATLQQQLIERTAERDYLAAQCQSSEQYRLLSENSRDLICMHDLDGTYRYLSQAVHDLLGYNPAELIGTSPYALFHPQDCERIMRESHDKAQQGDLENRIIYRIRRKDGSYTWFETHTRPIRDEQGQIVALQTASRDITLRKQIEETLRKFQRAVEQSPSCIIITNTTGAIEYINPQFTRLTGYTPTEVYGQNPRVLKSGLTPPHVFQSLWRTIAGGNEWHGELCNRKKNGELFWELASVSPILDDHGTITHYVAVKEDITQRKHAEETLRILNADLEQRVHERTAELLAANQRLQFHVENSPLAVIEWDNDFRVSFWSPQAEHVFGWSSAEVLGKRSDEWGFVYLDDQDNVNAVMTRLLDGTEPRNSDTNRNHTRSGEVIWCDWYNSVLRDEAGNLVSILSLVLNVNERKQAEEALRQSEEQFRAFFEQAPLGIGVSRNGITLMVNPAYVCMFGYDDASEIIGQPIATQIAPDERQTTVERAQRRMDGAAVETHFPLTGLRKDGTCFPTICDVSTMTLMDGGIASVAFFTDITEQKHAENALRESERMLATLMSNLPGMAYRAYNDEHWTMRFVSEGCTALTGYPPSSLLENAALSFADLTHPDDRQAVWESVQAALRERQPFQITYRVITADGSEKWVWEQGCGIFAPDGALETLEGFVIDITEQRQAQEALRRSEALLRETQRTAGVGGWELDLQRNTLIWTEQVHHIYEVEDDYTPDIADQERFFPPEALKMMAPAWEQLLGAGVPFDLEVPFFTAKGRQRWVRMLGKPGMQHDGSLCRVFGTFQDITHRKQIEQELADERAQLARRVAERTAELSIANAELERAVRTKDEFLANMSHELRTPLNAVLGQSEVLQEEVYGPLTKKQRNALRSIEESGRHLLTLINDILDLAKIEAGREELILDMVDIPSLCRASVRMIQQSARKKDITIVHRHYPDLLIQADERRLKQILVNLLSNAVKFTPAGGRVGLDVMVDASSATVTFAIWDTGVGIAPEHMERLFKPFVQVEGGLNRPHEGTGLGLSLVMRLTELHGGSVHVESTPGIGSRFSIALPYDPAAWQASTGHTAETVGGGAAAEPQPTTPEPAPVRAPDGPLILLAEDNESSIEILSDYLQMQGYRVTIARNGLEAVQLASEEPPALILMDIQMPRMDGLEATRRIRTRPELAHVPIIALTALAMQGDRERCLTAGATDYVSKPVSPRHLLQQIEALLHP